MRDKENNFATFSCHFVHRRCRHSTAQRVVANPKQTCLVSKTEVNQGREIPHLDDVGGDEQENIITNITVYCLLPEYQMMVINREEIQTLAVGPRTVRIWYYPLQHSLKIF